MAVICDDAANVRSDLTRACGEIRRLTQMDPGLGTSGETELDNCTYNGTRPVTFGHNRFVLKGSRRQTGRIIAVEEFVHARVRHNSYFPC